jgi:hypothetical protein
MLEIKHYRRFTKEEQKLLHAVANTVGEVEIDQKPDDVPRYVRATGKTDIVVPLAWLVFSFVGAGAAVIVKSFLQAIGSGLGKNFVKHFAKSKKSKEQYDSWRGRDPLHPVAVVYKVKPAILCAIRIDQSTNAGTSNFPETLKRIEKLAAKLQSQRVESLPNAVIEVRFDKKTRKWIVENHPRGWLDLKGR